MAAFSLVDLQSLHAKLADRHEQMVADLRWYVEMPTGSHHHQGLDAFRRVLLKRLAKLSVQTEMVPGEPRPWWIGGPAAMRSKLAREATVDLPGECHVPPAPPTAICRRIMAGRPSVLLSCHIDTVYDPSVNHTFNIAEDGKRATGPGCIDMKGGIVIFLHALEVLEEMGVKPSFTILLNSDEETGSFHSDKALQDEAKSGRYAFALAPEPALNGGLATARGGSGQFMIETRGKSAHAGRDFAKGISAVDALARAIVSAHELSRPSEGVTVNIAPLWCDQPTNQVPDHAAAWGNIRFSGKDDGCALISDLEALQRGNDLSLPSVQVLSAMSRPGKPCLPGTEALALAARELARRLGFALPFGSTAGVCDGNNLQSAGLPTIDTLGVVGGGAHSREEWIDLESLVPRAALVAGLLANAGEVLE